MTYSFLTLLAVFILTGLAAYLSGRIAPQLRLLDSPDHPRKKHTDTAALTGGICIFISFTAGGLLQTGNTFFVLLLAMGLMVLIGIADDILKLSPLRKFAMQISGILAIIFFANIRLESLGQLLGNGQPLDIGFLAPAFTLFALLLLVNAWNFMDGLDGLAGGISVLTFVALFIAACLSGGTLDAALILAAAVAGFLPFNIFWRRLRTRPIFLGEAGSLALGMAAGILGISSAQSPNNVPPIVIAWFLAFPVFDLVCVSARRMLAGHSPMRADKTHFHHLLCRHGLSPRRAVILIGIIVLCCNSLTILLWQAGVGEFALFCGWCLLLVVHAGVSMRLTRIRPKK